VTEIRKLTAILVADVVGYSRLAGADEERTLARLRALRSDLIDPTIARITAVLSSGPATARSSSLGALSTACVVPSKCRAAWSSEMLACRLTVVSSFVLVSMSATWSRRVTAI
jgi:adenylate cyclase